MFWLVNLLVFITFLYSTVYAQSDDDFLSDFGGDDFEEIESELDFVTTSVVKEKFFDISSEKKQKKFNTLGALAAAPCSTLQGSTSKKTSPLTAPARRTPSWGRRIPRACGPLPPTPGNIRGEGTHEGGRRLTEMD